MAVAEVQHISRAVSASLATPPVPIGYYGDTVTFAGAPTSGNTLVLFIVTNGAAPILPTGWELLASVNAEPPDQIRRHEVWWKVSDGTETSVDVYYTNSATGVTLAEFSGMGSLTVDGYAYHDGSTTATFSNPTGVDTGVPRVILATLVTDDYAVLSPDPTNLTRVDNLLFNGGQRRLRGYWREILVTSPPITDTAGHTSGGDRTLTIAAAYAGTPPPDPEPGVVLDPTSADPVPISDDIISWTVQRGASPEITGQATTGSATVVLKNVHNSAGDDAYNPDNASSPLIAYLRDGVAIHISVDSDGTLSGTDPRGVFAGRTADWTVIPAPGATIAPTVEVTCEDALGWYSRTPVSVGFETGRSQKEMRSLILADIGETRHSLANEITTMPLSSADGNALQALEAINSANGTRHFVRPENASADWYTYTTRNRQWRLDATVDASISALSDHVTATGGWRLSADTVTNQQKATATPIVFTPAQFVVWRPDALPLLVTTARPFEVWVEFDDYVAAPIVDSSHSGATPTITLTALGAKAHLTITVTSGTCTFANLTIQGSLARRLPTQSWFADDLTSQVLPRGIRAGSEISGEYVGTIDSARGIAEHVVWRYATPQRRPTLTVVNWLPEQFEIDLYDIISFTSPQLGVTDRLFEVVGLTHVGELAAETAVSHTVTYVLQECRVQADPGWFVLDDSLLDGTDILAY